MSKSQGLLMKKYDIKKLEENLLVGKDQITSLWHYNNEGTIKLYPYLSKNRKTKVKGFSISLTGKSFKGSYLPVPLDEFITRFINNDFPEPSTIRLSKFNCASGNGWLIRNLNIEPDFREKIKICEISSTIEDKSKHADLITDIDNALTLSDEELKIKIGSFPKKRKSEKVPSIVFNRNPYVVVYRLRLANGKCENCKNNAPFTRKSNGTPYLEVHHVIPLSEDGDDTVENTIALCPNCHRQIHYGEK
jgi:5-methylcytosine-specific restriction endonuclease McrA